MLSRDISYFADQVTLNLKNYVTMYQRKSFNG